MSMSRGRAAVFLVVVGLAVVGAHLVDRPGYPGEPLSGRLIDAVSFALCPWLVLALAWLGPGTAGPTDLLPSERTQVEQMIRESRPGEDARLRAAAVAICRKRLQRGSGPKAVAVLAALTAGLAVVEVSTRYFGTAILLVVLLALAPWRIHVVGQSQTRARAFLHAAEGVTATN